MSGIQQFLCNTVGEECLSNTGIAVKEQIGKSLIKITDKLVTDIGYTMNALQRSLTGGIFDLIRIIVIRKSRKILFFQNPL